MISIIIFFIEIMNKKNPYVKSQSKIYVIIRKIFIEIMNKKNPCVKSQSKFS